MRAIGFAGWSGAGKTTLIVRLIPELSRRGFGVSTIKHAHHGFDVDRPGKDSYEHRAAGAHEVVLVASANRLALMRELRLGAALSRRSPRPPAPARAGRPGPDRGLQARPLPQDRSLSRRQRQAAAPSCGPKHRCAGQRLRRSARRSAACVDRRHRRRGRSCARACGAGCGRSRGAQAFLSHRLRPTKPPLTPPVAQLAADPVRLAKRRM